MAHDQRNVTKLLRILRSATHVSSGQEDDVGRYELGAAPYDEAVRTLVAMDARSGRLDPSLRRKKTRGALIVPAPAKKARRR